jgi:putative transposase
MPKLPLSYEYITFMPSHKKWREYGRGAVSEILLTDRRLYLTFIQELDGGKPLGARLPCSDLNFHNVDSSAYGGGKIEPPFSEPLNRIVQVQNDFSRRRRKLQLHLRNPEKRLETRDRQRD